MDELYAAFVIGCACIGFMGWKALLMERDHRMEMMLERHGITESAEEIVSVYHRRAGQDLSRGEARKIAASYADDPFRLVEMRMDMQSRR